MIFETPSKRCPYRYLNGSRVTIEMELCKRPVRRQNRRVIQQYVCKLVPDNHGLTFLALADELFIEPTTGRPFPGPEKATKAVKVWR